MKTITLTEDAIGSILNSLDASGAQEQANCLREAVSNSDQHGAARIELMNWAEISGQSIDIGFEFMKANKYNWADPITAVNPTALWLAIQEREGKK